METIFVKMRNLTIYLRLVVAWLAFTFAEFAPLLG